MFIDVLKFSVTFFHYFLKYRHLLLAKKNAIILNVQIWILCKFFTYKSIKYVPFLTFRLNRHWMFEFEDSANILIFK